MQFIDFTVVDVLGAAAGRRKLGIGPGITINPIAPIQYNVVTGDLSIPQASAVQDGYLSAADFASFSSGVPSTRLINTTAPLAGGGDLSADRTLSIPKSTAVVDGYLAAADFAAFSAKESPLTFNAPLSRAVNTVSIPAATSLVNGYLTSADWTTFSAKVSTSRSINTTAPITGGGDLSADRTIAMAAATAAVDGYLTAANFVIFNSKVSTSRSISTSSPLTGGGDLSADRTISFSNQTANTVLAGPTSGGAAGPTFRALVAGDIPALSYAPTSRLINTTSPVTGGGDLTADRTIALDFTVSWVWTANGIAATPTDRIQLSNTTAAISGTQQISPALRLTGQGFGTTAGTSQACDWRIYHKPIQGTVPTSNLLFDFSVAGGAFATQVTVSSGGTYTIAGSMVTGTSTGSGLSFSTRSVITSPSDGVIRLTNQAASDFSRLQFGGTTSSFPALARSSAILKVRLADDSADGALACGAFTASGNLSFFGATAAGQRTFGAATAGGTYGATEQTMLQKCYDALRTFGFGT